MLRPVDDLPTFVEETRADAIIASCDSSHPAGGSREHVPFPPTLDGLRAAADEVAYQKTDEAARPAFPREEVAEIVAGYCLDIGAPPEAVANASRLAEPGSLAVVAGQQPLAIGGPMYVLYKAAAAVKLAREAEAALGVPVVPVFWNASEDHDIDEAAAVAAPARGGGTAAGGLVRFRADLEPWRGKPLSAVGPDERWGGPAREWIAAVASEARERGPAGAVELFSPREGEGWARWFSRILAGLLGREGLVVIEPQPLRRLCGPIFGRAIREWEGIEALLNASCDERARLPAAGPPLAGGASRPQGECACNFVPLGGPPLFDERDGFRRRALAAPEAGPGRLALRGTASSFDRDELATLAERGPGGFSSHAALRPVVQNALLPVVAQVLGPGEIAYQEELYRFHRSDLGAARRMPVQWPRLSATILDERAAAAAERFGVDGKDVFLPEAELLERFTPKGDLAERVRRRARSVAESVESLGREALALDATLARPLEKTTRTVRRAFAAFGAKVEAVEARARGFAPEKLRRLASRVRPGGKVQERVLSVFSVVASFGLDFPRRLLDDLDVFDRRHRIARPDAG